MAAWSRYAPLPVDETAARLGTDAARGLDPAGLESRRKEHGWNEIGRDAVTWHGILLRQFRSSFVYVLAGAAVLAFALGEVADGALIFLFVAVNAALGFYQEFHSEKAARLLASYLETKVDVIRGGEHRAVPARELVPGDLVCLQAGDAIPADVRFVSTDGLVVDESSLTGESVAIAKLTESREAQEAFEAANMGFSGTHVTQGSGTAVVIATGAATLLGETARLTATASGTSSLEQGLDRFSAFMIRLVLVTLALVFAAHLFLRGSEIGIGELAIFAVALAVSVIPEGLPVVMTFSLSRGAMRLAKRHVVVKRLSAIEDLGSIDVLCTDKTGTLTENRMGIVAVSDEAAVPLAALAGEWPSDGQMRNSFDAPLWTRLGDAGEGLRAGARKTHAIAFDPVRRIDSATVARGSQRTLVIRGAPEAVLAACADAGDALAWIEEQGRLGRRVIAIAQKPWHEDAHAVDDERAGFALAGAIAYADPLRASTRDALAQARSLGVAVKVITGDSVGVAEAVAREAGLQGEVISGAEFAALPEDAQHAAAERVAVFARVSPAQKHRIIQLLAERHAVGYLGDGINDAPALKAAGVGLAVQGATDIAREAADIILLDPSLAVVIRGIREGRSVFVNSVKYLKATLSSNFGNFYAVALGSLVIKELPMLPVQLLLLNLLTDAPLIAVAADNVDDGDLKKPKAYRVREIATIALVLGIVSTAVDFAYFGLFFQLPVSELQTNWFVGSVLTELAFLYSVRTRLPFWRARGPARVITALTVGAGAVALALPFTRFGQEVFRFTPPGATTLLLIAGIAAVYLVANEAVKLGYYRSFRGTED